MNNIKICALNFDAKVKIIIVICVIIAISILSYSIYNILIKNGEDEKEIENKIKTLEDITEINTYYSEYEVTVVGNKTENKYKVKENVDFLENLYEMVLDDTLSISISNDSSKISKKDIDYDYVTQNNSNIILNNPMSFSTIIDCMKKIKNKEINGTITKIEKDDVDIYNILIEDEYLKDIKKLEIYTFRKNCNVYEIKMYNNDEKLMYILTFEHFVVKK